MRTILFLITALLLPVLAIGQPVRQGSSRETEIRNAVTEYVSQKTANLGYEVRVKRLSLSATPKLPDGVLTYDVIAPQQWEGWGQTSMAVVVRQGDRVVRNIPVVVEVEALAAMVVAVRQIDYGSVISGSDIALRKQDVATAHGRFLASIEEAVGKKARTTLRANLPIKSDQLEKLPVVKSGQIVTIVAENERMRITVTGKARASGAVGDTIPVQNLNSLKELPARIIDAGTVVVAF